ncbi:MAG: ECF-type sigma factor [Pseudomonadota bacterium]
MDEADAGQVTQLLQRYSAGDARSLDQVVALVYADLQRLARQQLRRSQVGQRVQTTVLVHEAYEKLVDGKVSAVSDRRHFFAIAARAMRQIVVDTYRADHAAKRGGGRFAVTLTAQDFGDLDDPLQIVHTHRALEALAEQSPELAELVDLSCFAGLDTGQIAELSESNVRTVQRKLKRAELWLAHFLSSQR